MRQAMQGMAALLLMAAPAVAGAQTVEVSGEVRPRFEVRTPVQAPDGERTLEYVSMRARASLLASLTREVRAFVQLQDVRTWGTETSTTDPVADALDLHQGWVELGDAESGRFAVRAGRQELSYGGQRLVGALNWAQQARSFDGVRLRLRPTPGVAVDGFATILAEDDLPVAGAVDRVDGSFSGLYGTGAALGGEAQAYALYNHLDFALPLDGPRPIPADRADQYTFGARWSIASPAAIRVEAAYQTGERELQDVSAYLIAVRAGLPVTDRLGASLWYDRLSGDDDPGDGEIRVFDTLFATNHKFYGYMDLFLNIPRDTRDRGLQDLALKAAYDAGEAVDVNLDLHHFRLAATDGIDDGRIGEELDLTLGWRYAQGVALTGGLSYFLSGDAWSGWLGRSDDNQLWGYVMVDVLF